MTQPVGRLALGTALHRFSYVADRGIAVAGFSGTACGAPTLQTETTFAEGGGEFAKGGGGSTA